MTITMNGITRDEAKRMVGTGWSSLVDEVYDALPADAVVSDVKEKFGSMRVYWYGGTLEQLDAVEAICRKSYTICETCGQLGRPRNGGWILTLCDAHAETQERTRHGLAPDQ